MSTGDPRRCTSQIAHESAVVLACQREHVPGTTNLFHVAGGVTWRDGDDRIIAPPVGSTPVSEETARPAEDDGSAPSEFAPTEVRRAAFDAFEAAYDRSLDQGQIVAAIADAVYARGISEGRRQAAEAIRAADTSGWPGGRGSDVDECQERAARLAEQPEDGAR